MFLGIQDFDFAQILSILPKFNYFFPNFALSLHKSNQICPNFSILPNRTKLTQIQSILPKKKFLGDAVAFLTPTALVLCMPLRETKIY